MFMKHIGKTGDRKVAIVFREVPNEEHMCLVIYPQLLPVSFHDAVMQVLESADGQTAENLGDALFRRLLPDGRPILETLHKEGMIKKIQANQIIVTPNASSHIRLDELNKMINEMNRSEDAKKKLAEFDSNLGIADKHRAPAVTSDVLSDADIAAQRRAQAEKMEKDAAALLEESKRLRAEADALAPVAAEAGPKKRGRKPKAKTVESANDAAAE